jgi:hypothetical protein
MGESGETVEGARRLRMPDRACCLRPHGLPNSQHQLEIVRYDDGCCFRQFREPTTVFNLLDEACGAPVYSSFLTSSVDTLGGQMEGDRPAIEVSFDTGFA